MKNQDAMTDYAAGGFLKRAKPIAANSFPSKMPLGKFLFEYLYRRWGAALLWNSGRFCFAHIYLARQVENPEHHDDA
jgi:hypothetical protein